MHAITLCLGTFGGCLVSALVPLVNAELLILSMAAMAPPGLQAPIVLCAATGQIAGKVVLYLAGSGALRFRWAGSDGITSMVARLQRHRRAGGLLLLASASTGVPPLLATTVACGMIRFGLPRFIVLAWIGRIVRFGALVQLPDLIRGVL